MIPAKSLPLANLILSVADSFGITPFVKPFVDLFAPIAKVIIDLGYDWSGDPDVPRACRSCRSTRSRTGSRSG